MRSSFGALSLIAFASNASAAVLVAHSPLIKYAGHYPFEKVDGFHFANNPQVAAALERASINEIILREVRKSGVSAPIELSEETLLSGTCQPHNCPGRNWTVAYSIATKKAAVCFFDSDLMDHPRWFSGGKYISASSDGCSFHLSELPRQVAVYLAKFDR